MAATAGRLALYSAVINGDRQAGLRQDHMRDEEAFNARAGAFDAWLSRSLKDQHALPAEEPILDWLAGLLEPRPGMAGSG